MDFGSGKSVNAGFPEKKTSRPSGLLRVAPPNRLFASFLHAEKGRGCASMTFFAGLRFHARTDRHTRLFQVWPEGHLLSSHEERRQRRAKGVPPLGSPGSLPAFSLGKPAGGQTPKPAYIQKRAAARGLGGYKIIDLYYSHPPCDS